jgi:hypothetical protein
MSQIRMLEQIPNHTLQEEHLPRSGARWERIVPFASTFAPYEHDGFKAAAAVANEKAAPPTDWSLSDLRAALFFEYRRYNHFGYGPDAVAMVHIHAVVEEIRQRIQSGEHLRAET